MSGILAAMAGIAGGRLLTIGARTVSTFTLYGYSLTLVNGALTPTEFLATNITQLEWGTDNLLYLRVADSAQPNSGWSTININGTTFLRTSAAFASGIWQWSGVTTNPIGSTVGAVIPVNIA